MHKLKLSFLIFSLSLSAQAEIRDIKVPELLKINTQDPKIAQQQLNLMEVKYLWKMDGSDLQMIDKKVVVNDFMGNSIARADSSELVSIQDCYNPKSSTPEILDSYVLFERPSADYPVSGSLRVTETQDEYSKLEANSEFTIGGWFKQYPNSVENFKFMEPRFLAGGFMPALTRFAKSTPTAGNGMEWIFHMTNEIAYVNINRGFTGQNDMNQNLPWWAHTYGTCYQGGNHDECWHYVSASVNPLKNTVQFVISRQASFFTVDTGDFDFVSTGITNAQLNNTNITHFKDSVLQIAANEGAGTHGLIRGLFFARKALTPEQSKAISIYTAPHFKQRKCSSGLYLKRRAN